MDVVTCNAPIRGSYVLIQLLYTSPTSLMLNEVIPLTNVVDGEGVNAIILVPGTFATLIYFIKDLRLNKMPL